MAYDAKISRRGFNKLCLGAASVLASAAPFAADQKTVKRAYKPAQLVTSRDEPLHAHELKAGSNYIFHYPYVTTPCFLVDLGEPAEGGQTLETEEGQRYQWPGGVGPNRSIVAFSAICAHLMTYPAKQISFINYRDKPARFQTSAEEWTRRSQVIYCCSEKSVYDATEGARVLGGPAPQPLAVIVLDYDDTEGTLHATGTAGGEMFERFFQEFNFQLATQYGTSDVRSQVADTTRVVSLAEFCDHQVLC